MKQQQAMKDIHAAINKSKPKEQITDKTVRVLANSIYQTLREEGCESRDIIGVSSQLISLVTSALDEDNK